MMTLMPLRRNATVSVVPPTEQCAKWTLATSDSPVGRMSMAGATKHEFDTYAEALAWANFINTYPQSKPTK